VGLVHVLLHSLLPVFLNLLFPNGKKRLLLW
jgi:hypothetical protein